MLVHRRSLPRKFVRFPQQIAGTHLYTWVERGTVRVKCLAQEHNTMSPARARTRTARSGIERTNHEATAPPTSFPLVTLKCCSLPGKLGKHIKFITLFVYTMTKFPPFFKLAHAFSSLSSRPKQHEEINHDTINTSLFEQLFQQRNS